MLYHDIVVVGNITKTVEKALCSTFYSIFFAKKSSKAYILSYQNKILVFRLKVRDLKKEDLEQFQEFVTSKKCEVLFSETYVGLNESVDAYFFVLNSSKKVSDEEKNDFIQKIEDLISAKLQKYGDVYYFILSESQISIKEVPLRIAGPLFSKRLVEMLIQLNNPATHKESYGVRLSPHTS